VKDNLNIEPDEQIINILKKLNPILVDSYIGALYVLKNTNNPDRIFQSANSMRETIRRITEGIFTFREKMDEKESIDNKGKSDNTNKQKLIGRFDPHGGLPEIFHENYDNLNKQIQPWFVKVCHHSFYPTDQEYISKIKRFEDILKQISKPYFLILEEIDIILKNKPNQKILNYLKKLLTNYSSANYFFTKADDKWFNLLIKNDIFKKPSSNIKEKDAIYFVKWPASVYLKRMSSMYPQKVLKIICECEIDIEPKNRNFFVIEDFVDIAIDFPFEYSKKLTDFMLKKGWIHFPYNSSSFYNLYEKWLELSIKFIREREYLGKKIIDEFISVRDITMEYNDKDSKRFENIDNYKLFPFKTTDGMFIERINEEFVTLLADTFPCATIKSLGKNLNDLISSYEWIHDNIYPKGNNSFMLFDTKYVNSPSFIWLEAIEEVPYSFYDCDDSRVFLTGMLKKALLRIGEKYPDKLKEYVLLLKDWNKPIFRRLELYIYSIFPNIFQNEINNSIVTYLNDDPEIYHEHYILVKHYFSILNSKLQKIYISKINNYTKSKNFKTKINENINLKKEIEKDKINWKLRHYEPILEFLPEKEKQWYNDKLNKGYTVPIKGFEFRTHFYSNIQEGKDIGLSSNMSPNEIINSIKSYVMEKEYNLGSDDITSSKFREIVQNNPFEFSKLSNEVKKINIDYCLHFINALTEALRQKVAISWNDVLNLCIYLLKPKNKIYNYTFRFGANPIADLLINGFNTFNKELILNHNEKVIKIVSAMIKNTYPIRDNAFLLEEKEIRKDYNFNIYNSSLGSSIVALMRYNECYNAINYSPSYKFVPEVKKILDNLLINQQPIKIELFCSLAYFINTLITIDKNWVKQNLEKIFNPKNKVLFYATWECYLVRNNINMTSYEILFPYYKVRLEKLKEDPSNYHTSEALRCLILHIIGIYFFNLPNSKILFELFINKSSNRIKSIFLQQISQALHQHRIKGGYNYHFERVKEIWESKELQKFIELLEWFPNSPFDKRYSLNRLHCMLKKNKSIYEKESMPMSIFIDIIVELKRYAMTNTIQTLYCIDLLSEIASKKHYLINIKNEVLEILMMLKEKKDLKIKNEVEKIKNFYGLHGFNEFSIL
jgi:hypothetical protein